MLWVVCVYVHVARNERVTDTSCCEHIGVPNYNIMCGVVEEVVMEMDVVMGMGESFFLKTGPRLKMCKEPTHAAVGRPRVIWRFMRGE